MEIKAYSKYYIQGSDHYLLPRNELETLIENNEILYKENQELKSQLKGTTHCYDEEEHKRLSEQLELLISKLDEYDLIVDERNQLKKQLEIGKEQYNDLVEEKENLQEQLSSNTLQIEELKKQLKSNSKINVADHKYASECEDKVIVLETQQKEFIKYLEDEIKHLEHSRYVSFNEFGEHKLMFYKEVLQKYKSIIGVSNGNE